MKRFNKEKIFFLHIPKAAGTSINEMFALHYSKGRVKFHIEEDRKNNYQNIDTSRLDMFSGHVSLFEVIKYLPVDDFLRVTLVREPFQQLISHINWVRFISEDTESNFFKNHPDNIKEFSLKLRKIDFEDLSQVEEFFHSLSNIGQNLFNNCQTRYLFNGHIAPVKSASVINQVIDSLDFFDVIGTLDQLDHFMSRVHDRMNWKSEVELVKSNALNNLYKLDANSSQLREMVQPLICADQILYDYIVDLG
jgi:hypothetical protein